MRRYMKYAVVLILEPGWLNTKNYFRIHAFTFSSVKLRVGILSSKGCSRIKCFSAYNMLYRAFTIEGAVISTALKMAIRTLIIPILILEIYITNVREDSMSTKTVVKDHHGSVRLYSQHLGG